MRISDWSSDVCSSDLFGRDVTACLRGDRDRQVAFFVSGVGEDRAGPAGVVLPQLFDLGVEREVSLRERLVRDAPSAGGDRIHERLPVEDVTERLDDLRIVERREIGRASCRERECQYV